LIRHESEPLLGEHADEIMRDVLRFDEGRIAEIKASGALGGGPTRAAAEWSRHRRRIIRVGDVLAP
jgi:hypothetical protein